MKLREGDNKFAIVDGRIVTQPATPELDKLHAVKDASQACGEFVEWLYIEKHIVLATPHRHTRFCREGEDERGPLNCDAHGGELVGVSVGINTLLAEFFEIDLDKVEAEKRALLDQIRAANGGGK